MATGSGTQPQHPNRLAHETSPYLLQHADNPVDWYPWGDEALAAAQAADRPILLSIGYSACHWCHVMAHESFEDAATAQLMNTHFINIKVDREERPDLDTIYMTAVQAMTGGGGWPMTVFLTPDGVPFYGGTYFPPEDRYQMPSFSRVLLAVADAYANRRDELLRAGRELTDRMRTATAMRLPAGQIMPALLDEAYASLREQFDTEFGGFGNAPKFPQPMTLEFLLRYAHRTGEPAAFAMLSQTLRAMAEGGIYDQLGGGFHRYSVDAQWLVPHFEKMLYDNALLARVYGETYQATGDRFFRRMTEETLDYLVREMRHSDGGFFSTQDADSLPEAGAQHKHEGAFFVWTPAELREVLGADALLVGEYYGVSERGNFEGRNILHVRRPVAELARVTGTPVAEIEATLARSRSRLLAARAARPLPDRDEKILTSWNGMVIRALATAAIACDRDDYRVAAIAAARFTLRELRCADGRLLRSWKDGRAGTTTAFLEDYALLADGLLALYDATFDPAWLAEARTLADTLIEHFWDESIDGFYDTAADQEQLILRPRDTGDNATPCGNSAAADVLLRLATIYDLPHYRAMALRLLGSMASFLARYPTGFGRYLAAAEYALDRSCEVVIVGDPADPATQALIDAARRPFLPARVLVLQPANQAPVIDSPLLIGRAMLDGRPTAYVCEQYTCRLPVTSVEALRAQLKERL
ncbi:MAG TPA: thioredoxin domain-containing protein [Roseiflexaceae bacterium]|nr:thioredoxin domain-containing protein [Roseiflexaceae bacterium]